MTVYETQYYELPEKKGQPLQRNVASSSADSPLMRGTTLIPK